MMMLTNFALEKSTGYNANQVTVALMPLAIFKISSIVRHCGVCINLIAAAQVKLNGEDIWGRYTNVSPILNGVAPLPRADLCFPNQIN